MKSPLMGDVVVPTAATLPGSSYPWVQPVWVTVGTVTLARAPAPHVGSPGTEPIWKMVDGIALARVF